VWIVRIQAQSLDEVPVSDEEVAPVGQEVSAVIFADCLRLLVRGASNIAMGGAADWIDEAQKRRRLG
jgi:hypothetical protein